MKNKNDVKLVISYNKVKKTVEHVKPTKYFNLNSKAVQKEWQCILGALLSYVITMASLVFIKRDVLEIAIKTIIDRVYENKK